MAIVRFEQDPTQPAGTGNFTDDQGRTIYTTDLETAQRLTPSLASQLNQQSTSIATQAVGAPPAPAAGMVASNPGATGSAATGTQSPAEALVSRASQVPPPIARPVSSELPAAVARPAAPAPLPVASSSTSSTTVEGRPLDKVMAALDTFHAADKSYDEAARDAARQADERTAKSLQAQQGVELASSAQQMGDFQAARQERESAEQEVARLRGQPDEQVQPNRLLDNMSTGKSLGMVLLAAVSGAFGNMHGEGRNSFMDAINKRIDQDIEVQKDQIATGRIRRNNLIAQALARGADAKQAEAIARSKFYEAGANAMRIQAQALGAQGANLAATELHIKELDAARAARDNEVLASAEAKRQTTNTTVREAPKPVGANMSPLDMIKLQNALLDQQDAQEISNIIDPTGQKQLSPERVKELKSTVKEVGPAVAELAPAVEMTKTLVESMGGKMDVTTGAVTWPKDVKGVGPFDAPIGRLGKLVPGVRTDYERVKSAQGMLKEYVTKQMTGANSNLRQDATFSDVTGGALNNEEAARTNIENWARTLFSQRNAQLGRLGEDGQALYLHNTNKAKQGAGAPPLTPR